MTPAEVRHAQALLAATVYENPYIPIEPTEKQALLLAQTCDEVLYGGAAGGGKTDGALAVAAQYLMVPGCHSLVLRRTMPELKQDDGLLERSGEWWGGKADWNSTDHIWSFPTEGERSTVRFGSMEYDRDKFKYDGSGPDVVCIDEARHFAESQVTYMFSRLGRTDKGFPAMLRLFTNPGALWIRDRFDIQRPCPENAHGRALQRGPDGRVFIPAFMDENPHLAPKYLKMLMKLDPITRAQLLFGDWWIEAAGNMFDCVKFGRISRELVPIEFDALVRAWDFAATRPSEQNPDPDWTRGALWGLLGGRLYLLDLASLRDRWHAVEDLLVKTTDADGAEVGVVMPQDPAQAGKSQYERFVALLNTKVGPTAIYRYQPTRGETKEVMARPVSSMVDAGLVDIVESPFASEVITEFGRFPANDDRVHDDIVDTGSAALPRLLWIAARLKGRKVRVGVRRDGIEVVETSGRPRRPKRGER